MSVKDIIRIEKENYEAQIALESNTIEVRSKATTQKLLRFSIDSAIDTLDQAETVKSIALIENVETNEGSQVLFLVESSIWKEKKVTFVFEKTKIRCKVEVAGNGQRIKDVNYLLNRSCSNHTDYRNAYAPRFDWSVGKVIIPSNSNDSLGCQQWLSPPPLAYALIGENDVAFCGVAPQIGAYNFLSFDYHGQEGPYFTLTYEGHTIVSGRFSAPEFVIGFGFTECNEAIDGYIRYLRDRGFLPQETEKIIPRWWREPMFCSWGQMRFDYRQDHDSHENGSFINVSNYCTEKLLTNYVQTLDQHDINPGTIIIDMGWAKDPALHTPSDKRWFNMRRFIDAQHAKLRKVLLWYSPVITQGLPIEACMTLNGKPVAPDPTSSSYRDIISNEIRLMVTNAPDGLNADGFKIDFTQCVPSESGRFSNYVNSFWGLINEDNPKYFLPPLFERNELICTHGNKWGIEILKEYISIIYDSMKREKPESMLITHTANPYFAEVVDVLRLNDLDGESENVLEIMQNRASIAKMCSKNWLIDTDNDLMVDTKHWRDYIRLQPELGIPDTYYISGIAASNEVFEEDDYIFLKEVWNAYRKKIRIVYTE